MGLRSIHFGAEEEDLRRQINEAVDRFRSEVEQTCINYKKRAVKVGSNFMDDVYRLLHNVFNPAFVHKVLFNLDTEPARVVTLNELVPYRCNYPTEMTVRSKLSRGSMPCTRRLGNDKVYFCGLPQHMAYAAECRLPIDVQDIHRMGLLVPERPKKAERKATKKRTINDSNDSNDSNGNNDTAASVVKRESKRPKVVENDEDVIEQEDDGDDEDGMSLLQCCYMSVIDGQQCKAEGEHVDILYRHVRYCDDHVTVTEEYLERIFDSDDVADELNEALTKIHNMDKLVIEKEGTPCDGVMQELCRERFHLGRRHGLGLHPKWNAYLPTDLVAG